MVSLTESDFTQYLRPTTAPMNQLFYLLLALLCGAVFPVQAALNGRMAKLVGHPIWAAFLSFLTGIIALIIATQTTKIPVSQVITSAKTAPWYLWLGGLLGAYYVSTVIVIMPRLGVALTFGLIIAGQMFVSLILDHFGWLGVPVKPISWGKVAGALLLIAGVVVIRRF